MSDFWDSEELIGTISKNGREEIQIKKVEKKGKSFIDVRVFWFESSSGDFKPSQKGVAIPYESLDEFKKLIDSIK